MSKAEELCAVSLRLVLEPNVEFIANFRPDFLRNPFTGRNLELDFFLPASRVGIEVQGQHHYDSEEQKWRDTLKERLLIANDIELLKLSIFQVDPVTLFRKLMAVSEVTNRYIGLRPFDRTWLDHRREIEHYKVAIRATYGRTTCQISPHTLLEREKSVKMMVPIGRVVDVRLRGASARAVVVEQQGKKVQLRVLGSSETIFRKTRKLITENGGR